MASSLVPFLYQTRTLLRSRRASVALKFVRHAQSRASGRDSAIPFEWAVDGSSSGLRGMAPGTEEESTITPSEAEIFKNIFDEISMGKIKAKAKPNSSTQAGQIAPDEQELDSHAASARARQAIFAEKVLQKYPKSLRQTAQVALGLYEVEPGNYQKTTSLKLDDVDHQAKLAERAKLDRIRATEAARVTNLMQKCTNDAQLWKFLEQNVFSLAHDLGLMQAEPKKRTKRKAKAALEESHDTKEDDGESGTNTELSATGKNKSIQSKHTIEIHGPLFAQYLTTSLKLFDTAFMHPSPYAFQILPKLKSMGLPAYVLGVSTPFFAALARMHWERFGDAHSALDTIQEMSNMGLYADEEVRELVDRIADHLHACSWGGQGAFVMAMMEAPPYDGALTHRLGQVKKQVNRSLMEQRQNMPI